MNNHDESDSEADNKSQYSDDIVEDKGSDDEKYYQDAIKQIGEIEKKENNKENKTLKDLKVTTEGISQDQCKNINLQKVVGLSQCHWCAFYHTPEMIINDKDGNVCKHCYFCVNYSENDRLKFDTECCTKKGYGIATYILESYESHNSAKCTRKPMCFLCDYKQNKPITKILNPDMLGVCAETKEFIEDDDDNDHTYTVDSVDFIEEHQDIMFYNGTDKNTKFKIPKVLRI